MCPRCLKSAYKFVWHRHRSGIQTKKYVHMCRAAYIEQVGKVREAAIIKEL